MIEYAKTKLARADWQELSRVSVDLQLIEARIALYKAISRG